MAAMAAFMASPGVQAASVSPSPSQHASAEDLSVLLQKDPGKPKLILSEALRLVKTLETAETCTRLAALTLLNDCKSFDLDTSKAHANPEHILDNVKSEYAARLAVCEINGAGAKIPQECIKLLPTKKACAGGGLGSWLSRNEVPENKLCYTDTSYSANQGCLKALETRPQTWTSYSNAKQNAVVMCQASRESVERDKTIVVHKNLAAVVQQMSNQLLAVLNESQEHLVQQQIQLNEQRAFAEEVHRSQNQVLQVMKSSTEEATSFVESVVASFSSFKEILAQSDYDTHNNIQETRKTVHELRNELASLSSAQKDQLLQEHERQIAYIRLHSDAATSGINDFKDSLALLQDNLHSSSGNAVQKISAIVQWMDSLESKAKSVESSLQSSSQTIVTIQEFVRGSLWNPRSWLVTIATIILMVSFSKINPDLAWRISCVCSGLVVCWISGEWVLYCFGMLNTERLLDDTGLLFLGITAPILLVPFTYGPVRHGIMSRIRNLIRNLRAIVKI